MNIRFCLTSLIGLVACIFSIASAQEIRRAQPANEPPMGRPVPFDQPTPAPSPSAARYTTPVPQQSEEAPNPPSGPEATPVETESADRRQLNYADALFGRKLYDLAAPEYEKFIGEYPTAPGRASAYFYLGECYRALNRSAAAKSSFQTVIDQFGDSEFAGPASYGVAELLFMQKDYDSALPLFHRAAAKTKESALALSARYFEARCLENLNQKDEARDAYQQVIDSKVSPNPYRDDSRLAAGSILVARGRKADALKQYESLANETKKLPLRAEASVRAGMLAVELVQGEKGKSDAGMAEKAAALLQKGKNLPEAGKWRGIAQVGLLRLQYQSGQYAQVIAEYKRDQEIPDEVRPEMMLLVGNSHRQLGHSKEAEDVYAKIISAYPSREEAKDAQYQRLINLYNSDSPSLVQEVNAYLETNPSPERAAQAKLLHAEALYKMQNFSEAALLYNDLRSSELSPKLRAEAAYKLGWCYVQLKDSARLQEAFSYFLQAFPDNPQAPSALAQRALSYQESKNYSAALVDLNALLANYPKAREREAALQQKALILGQQEDGKGMSDAFRQLLKEFPKTAVAAQAHYYIGKAAFDAKDYKTAITELNAARTLNKEYSGLASLRIISAYFYLRDRAALTSEADQFMAGNAETKVPAEILEWLGLEYYNEKNYVVAEKYLTALSQNDNLGAVKPDFWFYLGDAESKLKNFPAAETAYEKYLQTATDPAGKAKVLLALGNAKIGAHKPDDAQKIAEEIMTLQPEGRVNAEARLLAGDVQLERAHFDEASKAFMGVALLYDDPAITPRALEKAAFAYERAGHKEEADRVAKQLHEKYPDYAGG